MNRKDYQPTSRRARLIAVAAALLTTVAIFEGVISLSTNDDSTTLVKNPQPTVVAQAQPETTRR